MSPADRSSTSYRNPCRYSVAVRASSRGFAYPALMVAGGTTTVVTPPGSASTVGPGLIARVVERTACHVAATAAQDRRAIAQIFTPPSVARFMAARASRIGEE